MFGLRIVLLPLGLFALGVTPLSSAPAPAPPKVPRGLLEARVKAARDTYQLKLRRLKESQGLPMELPAWSRRWLEAEVALAEKKADRVAAYQAHLDRMKEVERLTHNFARTGQGRAEDATGATYFRTEAEIWLIQAGGELPKQDRPAAAPPGDKLPRPPE
jgi:hypothetical protein